MGRHLLFVNFLIAATSAATTLSVQCRGATSATEFAACNSFANSNEACATVTDRPGKQKCLCNQQYLDSLFGYA